MGKRRTELSDIHAGSTVLALVRAGVRLEFPDGARIGLVREMTGEAIYVGTAGLPEAARFGCDGGGLNAALAHRRRLVLPVPVTLGDVLENVQLRGV